MRAFVITALVILSTLAPTPAGAQIYPDSVPRIVPLWHRVADFSPRLRAVESCALSPDGRYAVSGGKFGYGVMLWRVADGQLLWERHHASEVECVAFSPDGHRVATGGEDYFLRVWDVASGRQLAAVEQTVAGFDGVAWSPDGATIVGGDEAGNAVFIDASDYTERFRINCGSTINSLHYTPDGARLLVGGNVQTPDPAGPGGKRYEGFAKVIDPATRTVITDVGLLGGSVKSVRFAPDGKTFAAGGFDARVRVFGYPGGELRHTLPHPLKVEAVVYSPDGSYLLTGGHEEALRVYRTKDYALVMTRPAARTEYLDFSADGRLLLTAHEDSGLLSCYLLLSDVQARGNYQQIADEQLDNRDLKH